MKSWSVIVTAPQKEIRASIEIVNAGFEVFYPIKKYMRRPLNRPAQEVTGPLFPRYIFAKLDREIDPWGKIRDLRGVSNILCNGSKPVIVRSEIIDAIRTYREPELPQHVQGDFSQDQKVIIISGVLEGIEGLFKGSDRMRTKAFLDILGKRWDVRFDTIAAA